MTGEVDGIGSRAWLESQGAKGRPALVGIALAAARAALPRWEARHADAREAREVIGAVEAWLAAPGERTARAVRDVTFVQGDPDDPDGLWLVLPDGRVPAPAEAEAHFAADYAGWTVLCPPAGTVDAARAAVGCARLAGVPEAELRAALEQAATLEHQGAAAPADGVVDRPARAGRGPIGAPDRSRDPASCPRCGGDGFPIGPKESPDGVEHHPHRCVACGLDFDVEGGPSVRRAYAPDGDGDG